MAWKIFWLHQVSVRNSLFRILAIWLGKIWVWTPCTYFIFFASERRIDLFVYQFKLAWRLYLANIARDWVLWYRFPWSKVPFTRVWLLLASIRKSSQILQILSFTVKKAHWVNEQGRGRHWRLMVGEQRFGLINGWVVKSPFIKAVNFLIVQNVL